MILVFTENTCILLCKYGDFIILSLLYYYNPTKKNDPNIQRQPIDDSYSNWESQMLNSFLLIKNFTSKTE